MHLSEDADPPVEPTGSTEPAWVRRRRLAEVFGDAMPETTSDERDPEPRPDPQRGDTWLRDQVPPHHGPTG